MINTVRACAIALAALLLAPCALAGKYQLAYWRELGAYENQAPPAGTYGLHDVWIHVWNEDGTPRPNVQIFSTSNHYWGMTNAHGVLHVQLWSEASDFYCKDGAHLYEVSPVFDERRWPHSGHYSWEIGFVFRNSSNPPELFDLNYEGVINSTSGAHYHIHAPCTRSLAFISTPPYGPCQDSFSNSATITEAGQTFVAKGDRVVAAKAWVGAASGFKAQILEGGPNGSPIGPIACATSEAEYQQVLARWPVGGVAVVPGQTYYLKITALNDGAFTCKRTNGNTYSGGSFYENKSARTAYDLMGAVVMAWSGYGNGGRIAGRVTDVAGVPLKDALVSVMPYSYTAQTNKDGYYAVYSVPAGTYYLVASRPGYSRQTLYGRTVTAGATTTVNFSSLKILANQLTNPGFEDGLTGWNRTGAFSTYDSGQWAVPTHGGNKWAGNVSSYGINAGKISQQVNVQGDYEYQFSVWFLTDAFNGDRTVEFPNDTVCRLGIDPTGSGNPNSPSISWSGWASSYDRWTEFIWKANAQPPYAQMTVWLDYQMKVVHDWNKAGFDDAIFARSTPVVVVDYDPAISNITATSARITWRTNVKSDSRVDYGLTTSYGQSLFVSESTNVHVVDLTNLQPNRTYHFKVTSAASGYDSGSSADFSFTTARSYTSVSNIADLATLADNTDVQLSGKLVVAGVDQLGSMFYIQDQDGIHGVRVNCTDTDVREGDIRNILGTLGTVDGERCILHHQTTLISSGNSIPQPPGMRIEYVGGTAVGAYGPGTIGMLVRTWGKVGASGSDYFYLVEPNGAQIKVICGTLAKPTGFAVVTGCCGRTLAGGGTPVIRVRKQSDIVSHP